jgi:hypothetical protein
MPIDTKRSLLVFGHALVHYAPRGSQAYHAFTNKSLKLLLFDKF